VLPGLTISPMLVLRGSITDAGLIGSAQGLPME